MGILNRLKKRNEQPVQQLRVLPDNVAEESTAGRRQEIEVQQAGQQDMDSVSKAFDCLLGAVALLLQHSAIHESKDGQYVNVIPEDLRTALIHAGAAEIYVEAYIRAYRKIGLIVPEQSSKTKRNTNIQRIKGKVRRVLTIRKDGLSGLKELRNLNEQGNCK